MDSLSVAEHSCLMKSKQGESTSKRLLLFVIDDDGRPRESLPELLREFGFAARAFSSGPEFLSRFGINRTTVPSSKEPRFLPVLSKGFSGGKSKTGEATSDWRAEGPRKSFDALHFCIKKLGIFRSLNASVDEERNALVISPSETT
jgi:hypothetical protein